MKISIGFPQKTQKKVSGQPPFTSKNSFPFRKWFNFIVFPILVLPSSVYSNTGFSGKSNSISQRKSPSCTLPAPRIIQSNLSTFCQGANINLTAPIAATWLWSNGATTRTISSDTSGNFAVQITDANGCVSAWSDTIKIKVLPVPARLSITSSGSSGICNGDSLLLTASAAFSWKWSTGETSQTIKVKQSGYYTVSAGSANGCFGPPIGYTVNLNASPPTPTIDAVNGTRVCKGTPIVLSAPVSAVYLWNNGLTSQTISPDTPGTFQVKVVNSFGCSSNWSAPVSVGILDTPGVARIVASGPTTFCKGGNVSLTAILPAGTSPKWSNGSTGLTITTDSNGLYSVQAINANGCIGKSSLSVLVTVNAIPPKPIIFTNRPTTFCEGDSIILSAPAGFNYLWNTNQTSQTIHVKESGAFVVQINNGNCTSISFDSVKVKVNPIPDKPILLASGPLTFCAGDSVEISIANFQPGTYYEWNTGSQTQQIKVKQSGKFVITAYQSGCKSPVSDTIFVNVNPKPGKPQITSSGPLTFCFGDSVILKGHSGGNQLLWNNGSASDSVIVRQSGKFAVQAHNLTGCYSTVSDTVSIIVNSLPSKPTIIANKSAVCEGDSVILMYNLNRSSGLTTIWSNGANQDSLVVKRSGKYAVQYRNINGCLSSISDSVEIVFLPKPLKPVIHISGNTTFCQGDSAIISVPAGSSGYLWNTGDINNSVIVKASGKFAVSVKNANGCFGPASDSINVTVIPQPAAPVIYTPFSLHNCAGDSSTLNAGGNYAHYIWSNGATSRQVLIKTSGNYSVVGINATGCSSKASVPVSVTFSPYPPTPNISFPNGHYDSLTANVTASQYTWYYNFNRLPQHDKTIKIPGLGNYQVIASNGSCGSQISGSFNVTSVAPSLNTNSNGFKVYPNPSYGSFVLEHGLENFGQINLVLTDAMGREVWEKQAKFEPEKRSMVLEGEGIKAGVYFLKIKDGTRNSILKLIKK